MTTENVYDICSAFHDWDDVASEATYHGICRQNNCLKLKVNGVKMRGYGTLARAVLPGGQPPVIAKSGNFEPNILLDKGLFCRGVKTKKLYWFYGQLTPVAVEIPVNGDQSPKDAILPLELTAEVKAGPELENGMAPRPESELQSIFSDSSGSARQADCPPSAEALLVLEYEAQTSAALEQLSPKTLGTPAHKSVAVRQARFQQELVRIAQIRTTGLDPDVDMEFICAYFPTSPATAYRKIKLGTFPAPTKRGSRSVWPFSVIEAYRLGQWVNSVNAGASGT
jgi:predicted DNA-binding transcriptional regulator AlpA